MIFQGFSRRAVALSAAAVMAASFCLPSYAEKADTKLTAAVPIHTADYSIDIPSEISLGSLSSEKDTVWDYSVKLVPGSTAETDIGSIQITAEPEVELHFTGKRGVAVQSTKSILCKNTLTNALLTPQYLEQSGALRVSAEDIKNAAAGHYQGTLNFTVTYTPDNISPSPQPSSSPSPTAAPTPTPSAAPTPTPTPTAQPTATPTPSSGNGKYKYRLSVRKSDDFSSASMCDPLFYNYADVSVTDGSAAVTLYVIDPIPKYPAAENSPPLKDIRLTYSGTSYTASMGTEHTARAFEANSTFIGDAGSYNALPLTFTVPYAAITSSGSKTLLCSAYVNAVMKSTQQFYLVFSDGVKGETEPEGTPITITATESTAISDAVSTNSVTQSTGVKDGSYQIPVSAKKASSEEDSMMQQYMLHTADLLVKSGKYTLTVYVQHTVAGITGGGPQYISYNGTKAAKKENAKTTGGTAYDSFTFSLGESMPSVMKVNMYINAMSMEVSARLVFDLSALQGTGKSSSQSSAASTESESAASAASAASNTAKASQSSTESTQCGISSLKLGTSAVWQAVLYILPVLAAVGGCALYWWLKKRGS